MARTNIEKLKGYRDFLLEHYDRCPAIIKPKLHELNKKINEFQKTNDILEGKK